MPFEGRLYYTDHTGDGIPSLCDWDVRLEIPNPDPSDRRAACAGSVGVIGGELIIQAYEVIPFQGQSGRMYAYDGSQLTPIAYANIATVGNYGNYFVYRDELYFSAEGFDIPDGLQRELWKTDGHTIELVADLDPIGGSFPYEFAIFQDELYFNTNRGGRMSLFWTDGEGAHLVGHFPGEHGWPADLTPFQDHLYMEVWRDSGLYRMNSEHQLEVLYPDLGHVANLRTFQDGLYFASQYGDNGNAFMFDGAELSRPDEAPGSRGYDFGNWRYFEFEHMDSNLRGIARFDGTVTEDLYVEQAPCNPGRSCFRVIEFAEVNNELYISFQSSEAYAEGIWKLTFDPCNFNGDSFCDASDIDLLTEAARSGSFDEAIDLDADGTLTDHDRAIWVEDYLSTFFGDSNLDGQFNSLDIVYVFQVGEYEDLLPGNSTWATGDWDGDGDFASHDMVRVFEDGGYETGYRAETPAVPEPNSALLLLPGIAGLIWCRRQRASVRCA